MSRGRSRKHHNMLSMWIIKLKLQWPHVESFGLLPIWFDLIWFEYRTSGPRDGPFHHFTSYCYNSIGVCYRPPNRGFLSHFNSSSVSPHLRIRNSIFLLIWKGVINIRAHDHGTVSNKVVTCACLVFEKTICCVSWGTCLVCFIYLFYHCKFIFFLLVR